MDNSLLLGNVLKAWFAQNEWPQSVSEGLARAKGWTLGPWASQVSICMSGRLTPKPPFFVALGQFNQAVAERDLAGVTDRRLIDRLRKGQPLCKDDGTPWGAQDFFACYIGELQAPSDLMEPKFVVTQEMVDKWSTGIRESFRELCMTMMVPPGQAWAEVRVECLKNGVPSDEVEWVQEVVAGFREPTIEEASRQYQKWGVGQQPLIKALLGLQEKYGGDTSNIKKFLNWRQSLPKPKQGEGFTALPAVVPARRIGFDPEACLRSFLPMPRIIAGA